jgi:hypothetical protein
MTWEKNVYSLSVLFYFSCVSVILNLLLVLLVEPGLLVTKTTLASTRTIQFHAHTCARPCSMYYVCVHVQLRVVPVV